MGRIIGAIVVGLVTGITIGGRSGIGRLMTGDTVQGRVLSG